MYAQAQQGDLQAACDGYSQALKLVSPML